MTTRPTPAAPLPSPAPASRALGPRLRVRLWPRVRASRAWAVLALAALLAGCGLGPEARLHADGRYDGPVVAADGAPIQVHARTGPLPTLVFVHGWMCRADYWDAQVAELGADHATVTLDLAGHGASGGQEREDFSLDALADDVAVVLETLDLEQVVLVGHSMGGPVSLKVAAKEPRRVVGIVVVDSLHDAEFTWDPAEMAGFLSMLRTDWAGTMEGFLEQMFVDRSSAAYERVHGDMAGTDARVGLAIMEAYEHVDLAADFEACGVPVRCINARVSGETFVERNRGHHADYDAVQLDGVGHFVQMEDPARVNALIRRALVSLRTGEPFTEEGA